MSKTVKPSWRFPVIKARLAFIIRTMGKFICIFRGKGGRVRTKMGGSMVLGR